MVVIKKTITKVNKYIKVEYGDSRGIVDVMRLGKKKVDMGGDCGWVKYCGGGWRGWGVGGWGHSDDPARSI